MIFRGSGWDQPGPEWTPEMYAPHPLVTKQCAAPRAGICPSSRESRMAPVVEAAIAYQREHSECLFCSFRYSITSNGRPHAAYCLLVANGWITPEGERMGT